MDKLSFEILQKIVLLLPQKIIAICSAVLKQWHDIITNTPVFYSTINLHSVQRLKEFISIAKERYIQDKPMIHYVRHLVIHFRYKYFFESHRNVTKDMVNIQTIDFCTK